MSLLGSEPISFHKSDDSERRIEFIMLCSRNLNLCLIWENMVLVLYFFK